MSCWCINKTRNWPIALFAVAPIAFVSCAQPSEALPKQSSSQEAIVIQIVRTGDDYETIDRSDFAIVFVNTPWSATAIVARKGFTDFVVTNALAESSIKFDSFVVADESDDLFTNWIERFDLEVVNPLNVAPMGAGSVVWLKRGKLVGFELNTSSFSTRDYIHRTKEALE